MSPENYFKVKFCVGVLASCSPEWKMIFFTKQFFSHFNIETIITHIFLVTGPPLGKDDFDNAKVFEEKEAKKTPEERKAAFVALMANGAWQG